MFCHFVMLCSPLSIPRASQFLDHFSGDYVVLLMSFSTWYFCKLLPNLVNAMCSWLWRISCAIYSNQKWTHILNKCMYGLQAHNCVIRIILLKLFGRQNKTQSTCTAMSFVFETLLWSAWDRLISLNNYCCTYILIRVKNRLFCI